MKIKFTEYQKMEGEKRDGSIWIAYKIHGTALESDNTRKAGDAWRSTNIFKQPDQEEVLSKLFALEAGDKVDVVHKKMKGGWGIVDIKPITEDDVRSAGNNPTRGYKKKAASGTDGGSGNGKSDQMSKAEWAEKNRIDSIRIAKSVALKAAVENTKSGETAKNVLALADDFLPWLLDVEIGAPVADDGTDPLDPPA
jgi:hypothetical protein